MDPATARKIAVRYVAYGSIGVGVVMLFATGPIGLLSMGYASALQGSAAAAFLLLFAWLASPALAEPLVRFGGMLAVPLVVLVYLSAVSLGLLVKVALSSSGFTSLGWQAYFIKPFKPLAFVGIPLCVFYAAFLLHAVREAAQGSARDGAPQGGCTPDSDLERRPGTGG